ncbi:hypothetical protein TWF506_005787 [Arthrobotrys conoides]|uniref:Ricin B lectin domain-containing protein n=1 Tax=Arthrobotrys conoides TaxID=74498 RepID=A0AAN8S3V3_9PEZI
MSSLDLGGTYRISTRLPIGNGYILGIDQENPQGIKPIITYPASTTGDHTIWKVEVAQDTDSGYRLECGGYKVFANGGSLWGAKIEDDPIVNAAIWQIKAGGNPTLPDGKFYSVGVANETVGWWLNGLGEGSSIAIRSSAIAPGSYELLFKFIPL